MKILTLHRHDFFNINRRLVEVFDKEKDVLISTTESHVTKV